MILQLLGLWRWLKSGLSALLSLAGRYPLAAALIVALAACGWLWRGKSSALAERDKARAELIAQADAFKAANAKAKADQDALNLANQELSKRIAENAQARNAEIVRATNGAIADYARRNRLQNYCGVSASGVAPVHPDPSGVPESGTQPDMVAIPRDEFETLARKAVQDDRKTSFLIELHNEGLAVALPDVEFGGE